MDDFKPKADDIATIPCDDCGEFFDRMVKQLYRPIWLCDKCRAERAKKSTKEYQKKNPEKHRECDRRWREKNPEKARGYRAKWYKAHGHKRKKKSPAAQKRANAKRTALRRLGVIELAELEFAGRAPDMRGLSGGEKTTRLVQFGRTRKARFEAMKMKEAISG